MDEYIKTAGSCGRMLCDEAVEAAKKLLNINNRWIPVLEETYYRLPDLGSVVSVWLSVEDEQGYDYVVEGVWDKTRFTLECGLPIREKITAWMPYEKPVVYIPEVKEEEMRKLDK